MHARRPSPPSRLIAAALLLSTLIAGPAMAQTGTGSVSGEIGDTNGGVIPGAAIALIDERSRAIPASGLATAAGRFTLSAVPAATYTIEIALAGYRTLRRTGIVVRAGSQVSLGLFTLEEAATSEHSIDFADAPAIPRGFFEFARVNPFFPRTGGSSGFAGGAWMETGSIGGLDVESDTGIFQQYTNGTLVNTQPVDNTASSSTNFTYNAGGTAAQIGVGAWLVHRRVIVAADGSMMVGNMTLGNEGNTGGTVDYSGNALGHAVSGTIVTGAPVGTGLRIRATYDYRSAGAATRTPSVSVTGGTKTEEENQPRVSIVSAGAEWLVAARKVDLSTGVRIALVSASIDRHLAFDFTGGASQTFDGNTTLKTRATTAFVAGMSTDVTPNVAVGGQGAYGADDWRISIGGTVRLR